MESFIGPPGTHRYANSIEKIAKKIIHAPIVVHVSVVAQFLFQ